MSETYSHETLRDAYECGRRDALAAAASEGAMPESTGPAKVVAAVPTGSPASAPFPQPDMDASDYDDDVDYEAEGEEEYYDCGMICDRRGNPIGCQDAGSEQCDFECPNRDYLYACLAKRSGKQGNHRIGHTEK